MTRLVTHSRLSALLRAKRADILRAAERHGASRLRVFGSVAREADRPHSDVDLLVELAPGKGLLDLIAFEQEVGDILGVDVDVLTEGSLHPLIRHRVLAEAVTI